MRYQFALVSLLLAVALHAVGAAAKPALHFVGDNGAKTDVTSYTYSLSEPDKHAVSFTFAESDAARIRQLLRANTGHHVSVEIGGRLTVLPVIRDVPSGRGLELTLGDAVSFADVAAALAGTAPQTGK